jgi:hypothetical protein
MGLGDLAELNPDVAFARIRAHYLGAGRLHPFVQDGDRARITVDRHTVDPRL